MATRAPKEKRRNSEKRKEKSRDAARCRRSKESEIFTDMAQLLPVPTSLSSQLDKASVMRLTIAFLKARSLLGNSVQELCSLWSEEKCPIADACWPQALGGILLALSSEGDIIYLSENVTQQLGLPQVDLIGQSIYDYCHPCDHDELREVLGLRPDGELARSFFLRLKSTLTVKGRSNNLKAASYKVMNCSGRIVPASAYDGCGYSQGRVFHEDDDLASEDLDAVQVKALTSHFLVLIADPIPHPSNIEMPLDSYTFLTKHSLDMKYTYVDEKISDFLGYTPEDLEGHSAYQLHHAQDNDVILKSYKTLLTKGQIQTPPYRFLARHGGHAWVQTQATLVYGNRDSRPQAIVCVHTCLSEIEDGDQVLYVHQVGTCSSSNNSNSSLVATMASMASRKVANDMPPQNMTSKLFVPKTSDMDEGFLIFDKVNGTTVLKEEPEDLTHLAPIAGDTCIALDMPSLTFPSDLFDAEELTPEFLDCLPLTGFELPLLCSPDEVMEASEENAAAMDEPIDCPVPSSSSSFKEDPFIFFNIQTAPMSVSSTDPSSPLSPIKRSSDFDEEFESSRPPSVIGTKLEPPMTPNTLSLSDDDEELARRAPYIPMNESDDFPLFDPSELFSGMDLECLPVLPISKTESIIGGCDQSVLVKLLKNSPAKLPTSDPLPLPISTQQPATSYHAHKRCSITPADDSNPKRMKPPILHVPTAGPFSARVTPLPPSRGATSSLLELLTEKPRSSCSIMTPERQSSSVLQNLLVSGRDLQTGHDLQKLHSSYKAVSATSCFIPLLLSSLPSLEKDESTLRTLHQESDPGSPSDSSESTGSDIESKRRHGRGFRSLNTFPFDMERSPGSSTSVEVDAGDFFGTMNLSCEFITADGATE